MTQRIYPGMLCNSVEFFVLDNIVKAIHKGKVIDITEIPLGILEKIKEEIKSDIAVNTILHDLHPTSEWNRVEQFIMCRYGGMDFSGDINQDGTVQDGEYWDCPMRGKCKHEGVLCKLPMVNGVRLDKTDVELMKLSSTEMTNEHIASELNIPMGSFHKAKSKLHNLLGVQTKQGVTKFCHILGIV